MSKAIALSMKAHTNKGEYPETYLSQEPKPSFTLTNHLLSLQKVLGVTTTDIETKFTAFKNTNGLSNVANVVLYWGKWNPLLWGNAKDLEYASKILNTANPKPGYQRLLSAFKLRENNRIMSIVKATSQYKFSSTSKTKYNNFDGISASVDISVPFDKTGEKVYSNHSRILITIVVWFLAILNN